MTRKLTENGILPVASNKIRVLDMTGFMALLNTEKTNPKQKTKTIKGYRVKVEYGDDKS